MTLGSLAILARLLTPADYGLLAMLLTFAALVTVFRDLGLSSATIQRPVLTRAQASALFWVNCLVGVVLAAASVALAPVVAWFFHDSRLVGAVMASSIGFVFAGASAQHLALLSRSLRFGAFAFIDLASLVIASAFGIALALSGAGYWALVLMQPAIPLVQMVLAFILAGWAPGRLQRGAGVRQMLRFGGNLTGFNLLNYFARNGDNILIGRQYPPADLGAYTRAYSLLLAPISQVSTPFANVIIPSLSRIGVADGARYRQAYSRAISKLCVVTMPVVAFALVTSDWVVEFALGPQWSQAASIFFFLGFAGLVEPIANSSGWLFITQNRTGDMLRWSAYNLPLTILAFVVGLPFGPEGVAAAYALYSIGRMPFLFWYVGRTGPVPTRDFYRALAPGGLAACAVMLAVAPLRYGLDLPNAPSSLLVAALVGGAAALASLWAFPTGRAELRDIGVAVTKLFARP